jgi:signal transduction histidine kinase/ActR/RegA family two-component response regulator
MGLIAAMSQSSKNVLQKVAEAALELTGADSAGISVLETNEGAPIFRWRATAGKYLPFGGATMPRNFSPCGVVLDRNATQLMSDPVKAWPYIADLPNRIYELLLVPFYRDDCAVGTVWAVTHRDNKHFDSEDARLVGSISNFAAAAVEALASLEALDAANKDKERFFAVLSHELRTPLTPALLTSTQMQQDESLPASVREDARLIQRNIEIETRLIDDLLDVSRIASGKIELKREFLALHELLSECVAMHRAAAEGKNVQLVTNFAAKRDVVSGDPMRLRQVFSNLLGNAIKFTPDRGRITLVTGDKPDGIEIEVRDTGVGIDPAILPNIFEPFEQGGRSVTRQYQGLGLGLAIAKGFVIAHGGRITAQSHGNGRGTTLRVSLPTVNEVKAIASVVQHPMPDAQSELHILLVEDHEDSRLAMSRLLRKLDYHVETAGTVTEALTIFDRGKFDLLISDVGLPDGSGLDLMRQIRSKRMIDGIALTGYGSSDDIERTLRAGFALHLTKPIRFDELQNAVKQMAAKKAAKPLMI